jgi:hypothetical protein
MPEGDRSDLARIEWALTRIERAVQQNKLASDALARRHAALKSRMAEALTALDEVIAREGTS